MMNPQSHSCPIEIGNGRVVWPNFCVFDNLIPLWVCLKIEYTPHKNKMQPTNPNAHTYVNGDDVETHGNAVMQSTFLKQFIYTVLYI